MSNTLYANISILIGKQTSQTTKQSILLEHIYLLNDFLIENMELKITTCNGEVIYLNALDWGISDVILND
ncbi:hypothetical protein [Psychrobacillus phage Perkons]|nr:hypothetical protein [Psychrobacillus phage Perkons]